MDAVSWGTCRENAPVSALKASDLAVPDKIVAPLTIDSGADASLLLQEFVNSPEYLGKVNSTIQQTLAGYGALLAPSFGPTPVTPLNDLLEILYTAPLAGAGYATQGPRWWVRLVAGAIGLFHRQLYQAVSGVKASSREDRNMTGTLLSRARGPLKL